MQIHNLMEEIVKSCLKDLIHHRQDLEDCTESNQADIMAVVLNSLPPKYVSTDKGEMFVKTQLRAQVETDVYRELSLAIEKVMKNYRKTDF